MSDAPQRFQCLAEEFEVLEHDMIVCQSPQQRRELLSRMLVVIGELDQLLLNDMSWLDSKPGSTSPSNPPPLSKAAHK